ncbi:hypothetical protein PA25_25310 [Pseudoalteromonas sp. A25]|uniref:hypothetical protein n=1 Tax=Pseudoalteromonas sp. A25 TaxID=116092 RepID=UPI001260705B|nr:hypothetical protein [Pseudoalteromonas sp. A25]BBN82546.1 hypothetical protein PA25_25310 [Pseudoalteromonas sp. A25]
MNRDDIDKHMDYLRLNKIHQLEAEFERLRPSLISYFLRALLGIFMVVGIIGLFPQIMQQPVAYLLLFLIVLVAFGTYYESHRVNKRIDALHQLLLNESKQP